MAPEGPLQIGADLKDLLESGLQALSADEIEIVEMVAAAEVLGREMRYSRRMSATTSRGIRCVER
jgi:hypothetical protein